MESTEAVARSKGAASAAAPATGRGRASDGGGGGSGTGTFRPPVGAWTRRQNTHEEWSFLAPGLHVRGAREYCCLQQTTQAKKEGLLVPGRQAGGKRRRSPSSRAGCPGPRPRRRAWPRGSAAAPGYYSPTTPPGSVSGLGRRPRGSAAAPGRPPPPHTHTPSPSLCPPPTHTHHRWAAREIFTRGTGRHQIQWNTAVAASQCENGRRASLRRHRAGVQSCDAQNQLSGAAISSRRAKGPGVPATAAYQKGARDLGSAPGDGSGDAVGQVVVHYPLSGPVRRQ